MKQSRGQLTRSKISRTALKLLDQVGMNGLSMRKLGAALGVEAMSLYNHVKNKADLLDAIHELLLEELLKKSSDLDPGDWESAVRSLSRAFLDVMKRHPSAIPLFASRSAKAPGSLMLVNTALGILQVAGLSPKESLMTFQTLFALIVGHAQFHHGERDADSYTVYEDYQAHPHLAALGLLQSMDPDEEFDYALDLVISGLQSRIQRAEQESP